jgi:hypothetical protein
MSKRLYFLISFVLVVCLSRTVHADAIEVNNPSFEYDINGAQITEQLWCGQIGGWTVRNESTWNADAYMFATVGRNFPGFKAADGTVAFCSGTLDYPDNAVMIYQILDDPNATIAACRRYTLTFNAINPSETVLSHDVNCALFYSTGEGEANDVILAKSRTPLLRTSGDYNDWDEVMLRYIAFPGASSAGETLGVRLCVPGWPDWPSGHFNMIDNVRVDWILAVRAYDPYPVDGARNVAKNVTLGWKPGLKTQPTGGHKVYFGTDETAVKDANTAWAEYQGTQDGNTWSVLNYAAGGLELGRTYYWRVDEVNDSEVESPWEGNVWRFEVTGYATNPSPYDGEVDVPFLNQSLSWTAGTEATSHDVYFGEDVNVVADANTNSPEYEGNQALGNTTYPLTGLVVGETYYWRIDERSLVHPSGLKGDIWSFTIGQFLIVEDFDSYENMTELYEVWDDYWVNSSDGGIDLMREDPVRSGHSVELVFDNVSEGGSPPDEYYIGSWTDAQDMTELEIGSDWTVGGVKALTLYIMGDASNIDSIQGSDWGAAWPWVELEDTSSNIGLVKVDDPNVVLNDDWYEWNIELAIFDACGVTLSAIDRVAVGVGGVRTGQTKASRDAGHIYIEDIRVYPRRCRTDVEGVAYLNSKGDITGPDNKLDCTVDYLDLDLMATDWLVSDYCVPSAPPAAPPEVWYRFDDGPGSTVVKNDGTWSGYDITIGDPPATDEPAWTTDVAPAIDVCDPNYALDFTRADDDHLDIPNSAPNKFVGTQNMSITAWIKPTTDMGEWDWPSIVESRKDSDAAVASGFGFAGWGELIYWWNNDYWDWGSDLWVPTGKWSFVAVTVEPNEATIYLGDGSSVDSATFVAAHAPLADWGPTYNNLIGMNTSGGHPGSSFNGKIDDVRLYNKTLTLEEIRGLAGFSYMPNPSVANIAPKDPPPDHYDPNAPDLVNFLDYAKQADNWLDEFLWP